MTFETAGSKTKNENNDPETNGPDKPANKPESYLDKEDSEISRDLAKMKKEVEQFNVGDQVYWDGDIWEVTGKDEPHSVKEFDEERWLESHNSGGRRSPEKERITHEGTIRITRAYVEGENPFDEDNITLDRNIPPNQLTKLTPELKKEQKIGIRKCPR